MEGTRVNCLGLRSSEGSVELCFELVPGMDVTSWEIRVPVLSEALQREDEGLNFTSRSVPGCFDGRFVLE